MDFSSTLNNNAKRIRDNNNSNPKKRARKGPFICKFCGVEFNRHYILFLHVKCHYKKAFSSKSDKVLQQNTWVETKSGTKEERIATLLTDSDIFFERDVLVPFNCANEEVGKCARLDFVVYKENYVFFIECDENQHSSKHGNPFCYTVLCEIVRMARVQEALTLIGTENSNDVPRIVWIRYNPDMFFIDGERNSKQITTKMREQRLINIITTFIPTQPTTVIYMFYDCITVGGNLRPSIMQHNDFNKFFAKFVIEPIFQ